MSLPEGCLGLSDGRLTVLGVVAGGAVFIRTADNLEGPWTPDVQIFQAMPIDDGLVYAGVAHPYLDETGKTLVVSYTNNNHIEVLRVEFA